MMDVFQQTRPAVTEGGNPYFKLHQDGLTASGGKSGKRSNKLLIILASYKIVSDDTRSSHLSCHMACLSDLDSDVETVRNPRNVRACPHEFIAPVTQRFCVGAVPDVIVPLR
jgi:hypothetical protein